MLGVAIDQRSNHYEEVYDYYKDKYGEADDVEKSEYKVDLFWWKVGFIIDKKEE